MIKIRVVAVGKDKDAWISDGLAHYEKLVSRYAAVDWTVVTAVQGKGMAPAEIKRREAERLGKHLGRGLTVALADRGKACDSPALARLMERWQTQSGGTITFVIGGAYGLDPTILKAADFTLSLSSLTFSHQLVRLVLLEQLFRAFSILHGTDYHK